MIIAISFARFADLEKHNYHNSTVILTGPFGKWLTPLVYAFFRHIVGLAVIERQRWEGLYKYCEPP